MLTRICQIDILIAFLFKMDSKFWPELMKGLEQLFEKKENYDVIIQAGEGNDQKEIYAHSVVLCCQSSYFDKAISTAEKKDGKYIFKETNFSSHILEPIIRYLNVQ